MTTPFHRAALIVGAGHGLSAALARHLAREGMLVALAARDVSKIADVASQIGAETFACDATDPQAVRRLFDQVEARIGAPDLVVYNAGLRAPGALIELEPEATRQALMVNAFGGFLVAQQAARRMLKNEGGRDLLHRRVGERQRLREVGAVRDGQVRLARSRPESGARAWTARHPRRPFRHRRRHSRPAPHSGS